MRILAINNYSLEKCLENSKKGIMPAHHTWGCDYLSLKGHDVKFMYFNNSGGVKKRLSNMLFCLRNISFFNQFDIIIAFANPIIGWCALFKKVGLIKSHLYTLVHHCSRFMELYEEYDKIFFLSERIQKMTQDKYPKLSDKMFFLEWGPDLPFYESTYQKMLCNNKTELIFISTGKTCRDLNLVTSVCKKMNLPLIVITDKVDSSHSAIESGQKGKNAISYQELLNYMSQSTVSLIPIDAKRSRLRLCGLTSFLDALALGQPIIMSDNTNISVDIEGLEIGLVYQAGNEADLTKKLNYLSEHPEYVSKCRINARQYAINNSYENYCKRLEKLLQI